MCDFIPGEVLGCYRRNDLAGSALVERVRSGSLPRVQVLETLSDKLHSHQVLRARAGLEHDFVRFGVPPYEELAHVNTLHLAYQQLLMQGISQKTITQATHGFLLTTPEARLQLGVNSWLTVCGKAPVGAVNFTLEHSTYQKLFGWTTAQKGVTTKVLIVDSGVFSTKSFTVVEKRNFIDKTKPLDVTDDNNHGTAVASIIEDLCPGIELLIYKVADKDGKASEWDLTAALATHNDAAVINISLAFGLKDRQCPKCGRASHSSRSKVFEKLIGDLQANNKLIVVAAAGNESRKELDYPARFHNVIAVESINKAGNLSDFSNCSDRDHNGDDHPNVFVLPGGQKSPLECAITASDGTDHYGTSFAAAYGSAVVAATWSRDSTKTASDVIQDLKNDADTSVLPHYDRAKHGNGLMKFA